jgi:hypothetical protein
MDAKKAGAVPGKIKKEMDKGDVGCIDKKLPKRAEGGRVGADKAPFTSAKSTTRRSK